MWIAFRLFTLAIVALARVVTRGANWDSIQTLAGGRFVYAQRKGRYGRIHTTLFGVPLAQSFFLRLTHERGVDRWFKAIGFSQEIQSGDEDFDRRVYVACDHPAIGAILREDAEARQAILTLLEDARCIYTDEAHLWVKRSGHLMPSENALAQLDRLSRALATIRAEDFQVLRDRFFWKVAVVEGLAWGVAFYGVPSFFENLSRTHVLYFDWSPVIGCALLTAVGVLATLMGLAWFLLRGSSRAHRIFVESAIVLAIGVPLSSIAIVSDANVALDARPKLRIEALVDSKYVTTTTHKGTKIQHYHLAFHTAQPAELPLPSSVEVPYQTYSAAVLQRPVFIMMGRGALNIPWVEDIRAPR